MNSQKRNFANPWPRMALACVLTVWAGANLWSCVFRWSDIVTDDVPSRTVGVFLSILFALLPMVIAIYLFWSVVVGPEDQVAQSRVRGATRESNSKKSKQKKPR